MFTLFIPAEAAGMQSYCDFTGAPNKRLFVFKWLVMYIWITLASIVGIYSIARMMVVIVCRSREACSQMTPMATSTTVSSSLGSERAAAAIAMDNRRRRRRSSNLIIVKALGSVIWFPIMPIISLGFNTAYSIVWYRTQNEDTAAFVVDKVLQFLAVPLMAMAFYLSPPVRRAFK
ncbi:hypothetical protein EV174_004417, partial [Coemansia sp. RSA 2320]